MSTTQRTESPLVLVFTPQAEALCRAGGAKHVRLVDHISKVLDRDGKVVSEVSFFASYGHYVIMIPPGHEEIRDGLAIRLGDVVCRWAYVPEKPEEIPGAIAGARPMWTDVIAAMGDIPDVAAEKTYTSGFDALDRHGFRITLPAFMPVIGPYGSGKSVFLRQLLVNLWRQHKWKFLLTSFEERVKPRFQRDLRRHLIGAPMDAWSEGKVRAADLEIDRCAVFLRRPRNEILDMTRLLYWLEFAVKVHGVRVVAVDPINEIDHVVPKGESKTDYLGKFIMALKKLADDYGLLVIVCAHPPKDGVEKRTSRNQLLTLNDGADTAHWGNKADIGFCVWRDYEGPTYLHCDKLKDHESMGKPFLAEMRLDTVMNQFNVTRMGYDILQEGSR